MYASASPVLSVRIVRPPKGEAPEWVREAWVGLVLPLKDARLQTLPICGVLSGPRSGLRMLWDSLTGASVTTTGYLAPAARAIEVLEASRPLAARWWRDHAPRFLREEAEFLFDAAACERLGSGG